MTEHPTLAQLRVRARGLDLAEFRLVLEDAATFASLSVRTPTRDAERTWRRWVRAGRPAELGQVSGQMAATRTRRLASVRALTDGQLARIALAGSPVAEGYLVAWCWGYGPAKAAFTLACAGVGTLACIDGRLARKHRYRLCVVAGGDWDRAMSGPARWRIYLAAVQELYGEERDTASAQWWEWLADLRQERYSTDHGLLLGQPDPQLELDLAGFVC